MKKLTLLLFIILSINIYSEEQTFPFLDIKSMGAHAFLKEHPECDGRNVVIFILDNSVDPTVPGLLKTSENKPKVVDMQDFSNQLVINLKEAEFEKNGEIVYLNAGGIMILGSSELAYQPSDGKFYYGAIDEELNFKNSPVKDLNSNGRKNDKFAVIAFKIKITEELINKMKGLIKPELNSEQWVYFVDEDCDNNIDDEEAKFNYKYNLDYFNFYAGEKGKRPMIVLSANINNNSERMVINTCDGSHGTHCAGIASGFEIYNSKGNNGIAPGAYIVSLKIGSNLLSGGASTTAAMKNAYEYGIQFLKESKIKYGVFSMSYGIGSESPGNSEIEKFLDRFVLENPNIIVINSNGNNGPGINSTGNPAGANNIISAGAMLPVDVLKNLYGSQRTTPWITNFSSRGGETAKPDVIAPGGAASTVPAFETGETFWGTSMACPQTAGAAAILFSAADFYNYKVNGAMIAKAIKYGAVPLDNYLHIDQGSGLVNISNSFNYFKELTNRNEYDKSAFYLIETANSFYKDKKGRAAFWKSGGYFPNGSEKQNVSVKPIFYNNLSTEMKHNFYRAFTLKSDSPWLKTDKDEIFIRGESSANFALIYDSSKINKPGIYSGRISAKPKGEPGENFNDFDVQANIIIPYRFGADNNYELTLKNEKLLIGNLNRIFFEVPIGATSVVIKISPIEGKPFNLAAYLFNPVGNNSGFSASYDDNLRKEITFTIQKNNLISGIWELLPVSSYQSLNDSYYNVNIKFNIIKSDKEIINSLTHNAGEYPKGSFSIMSYSNNLLYTNLSGSIEGYKTTATVNHSGSSTYQKFFKINNEISKCEFEIEMDEKEYNKTTDIAFNIYDESNKIVYSGGFGRMGEKFSFKPASEGTYKLEIEAGFTHKSSENENWSFKLVEKYFFKNDIKFIFSGNVSKLYPGVWNEVKFSCSSNIPQSPSGFNNFGKVDVKDIASGSIIYVQDVELKTN